MLTQEQVNEIRTHLGKSQNPLFFFDNDVDGLCSFLLLQRFAEKGKGVPVKSFPELTEEYFRKVHELNADYIFILDKPLVSDEFFQKSREFNIPVVCIDHHDTKRKIPEFVNYYNPVVQGKDASGPTTYLCYQISNKREDMWLAVIGCISDKFFPEFYADFKDNFPDLAVDSEEPFHIRYRSQIGKITNLFSFALKDRTTNVINMLRFLMKVKSPYDVLNEMNKNYFMHQRYNQINSKYQILLQKAKKLLFGKVLFFRYRGDLSISSDLANELNYIFPEKIVVVAYDSGIKANISARGKNVRKIMLEIIRDFTDSTGGGHEEAIGVKIQSKHLDELKRRLISAAGKQQ